MVFWQCTEWLQEKTGEALRCALSFIEMVLKLRPLPARLLRGQPPHQVGQRSVQSALWREEF